jgi:hypothetical protein
VSPSIVATALVVSKFMGYSMRRNNV